jgi:integrase
MWTNCHPWAPARCWWTIPAERAKNGLAHRVPLSPAALRILETLKPEGEESAWVFPSRRKACPHINHVQKAIERIVDRSGVPFRGHDLRRTAASLSVTAVYDRHSDDLEKRVALDFWADGSRRSSQTRKGRTCCGWRRSAEKSQWMQKPRYR